MRTLLFALSFPVTALAAPLELTHQGRLLDASGVPVTGNHQLVVRLFTVDSGGTAVWSEQQAADVDNGYYAVRLGDDQPLSSTLFTTDAPLYLEVEVDGTPLAPRQMVLSVPFAISAGTATNVSGGVVDATEIKVDGRTVIDAHGAIVSGGDGDTLADLSCTRDQLAVYDGTRWGCATSAPSVQWADVVGAPDDADTLGDLTCAADQVPVYDGNAWKCSSNAPGVLWVDVVGPPADQDTLAHLTCAAGNLPKYDGSHWVCAPATVPWADVLGAPTTLGSLSCSTDQIAAFDGVGWRCKDPPRTTTLSWGAITAVPPEIDSLDGVGCSDGQHPVWDGGGWACEDAPDVVGELAATDHVGVGMSPDVDVALEVAGTLRLGTGPCDPDNEGAIGWEGGLVVCDGADWVQVALKPSRDGSTAERAADSCAALHADFPALPSAGYWIAPLGTAFRAYCDMVTDGGGWTLVGAWGPMNGYAMYDYRSAGRLPDEVVTSYASPRASGTGTGQGPAHYSAAVVGALFSGGSRQYLTLVGKGNGGSILTRHTKTTADAAYDPYRGVYQTQYMKANGFTLVELESGTNANPLPISAPAWVTDTVEGRSCSDPPGGIGCYHYLPDDVTSPAGEWLFRENVDDSPFAAYSGSSTVPSLLFVR